MIRLPTMEAEERVFQALIMEMMEAAYPNGFTASVEVNSRIWFVLNADPQMTILGHRFGPSHWKILYYDTPLAPEKVRSEVLNRCPNPRPQF